MAAEAGRDIFLQGSSPWEATYALADGPTHMEVQAAFVVLRVFLSTKIWEDKRGKEGSEGICKEEIGSYV